MLAVFQLNAFLNLRKLYREVEKLIDPHLFSYFYAFLNKIFLFL